MNVISIIIPVYNAERYLTGCLNSVLAQSFTDWECICVDDGSTDGSGRILDAYAEHDERFKVIHKENGGVSSARNVGLETAEGEWITFVDSDDELFPYSLQTLFEGTSADVGMIMCGYEIYDECYNVTYSLSSRGAFVLSNDESLEEMYTPKHYRYQGYCIDKLFKRENVVNLALRFDEKIYFNEDRLFCVKYLCRTGCRVLYDLRPVYKYIERATGAMASLKRGFNPKFVTDFEAFVIMREEIIKAGKESALEESAKKGIIESYRAILSMMLSNCAYNSMIHKNLVKKMKECGAFGIYLKDIKNLRMEVLLMLPPGLSVALYNFRIRHKHCSKVAAGE